jgi:arylsulfatase A-like enzyme
MAVPRSLVLITVDCLRADHVGFLGYPVATTPFLDSLATESFVFKNALASGIPTYYSLPAVLASRYPLSLGRDVLGIAPGESTIATELKECGYKTAAFIAGNPYISRADGYGDGFDVFRDFSSLEEMEFRAHSGCEAKPSLRGRTNQILSRACHSVPGLGAAYDELYFQYCQKLSHNRVESLETLRRFPSADVLVDCATAWLGENSGGPFFLWIHLMDPHAPYYPKAEALQEMGSRLSAADARDLNSFWTRNDLGVGRLQKKCSSIESLYNAGIRWADHEIGRLSTKLAELNLWHQCAIAVTADHGEEFLDHGGRFHSPLKLNEELVRVPLLLRVPGYCERREFDRPFGLIDLAPTLLDVLDIPTPASFRGRSCWKESGIDEGDGRAVFTECAYECTNPLNAETRLAPRLLAVRKGEYKLVVNFAAGTEDLFDLNSDPKELRPLPMKPASEVRRNLLECAKKHVTDSYKTRDLDLRLAALARDLRQEWAQPIPSRPN